MTQEQLRSATSTDNDGETRSPNAGKTRGKAPRQSELVLALTRSWTLFHDGAGGAYATFAVGAHRETWALNTTAVRGHLTARFLDKMGYPPSERVLHDVIKTLEAQARFQGPEHPVARRVARHQDAIYLDLCDAEWRVVCVTASGWSVVSSAPVRFVRAPGMLPLPVPVRGGTIDELRVFLNVPNEDEWRLVVAWLLMTFRPEGPYPILVQYGGEGSAKSTTARALRWLTDPNEAPLRSLPHDERDLAIAATNGWVLAYDNVSQLPPWLSDSLCRVATGAGFATRRLFTDNEEARFCIQRPILLNGIESFATREDFLSRTITVTLPRIEDAARRSENQLWAEFEQARPRILGALLDAVVGALRNAPTVNLPRLPRMADFALWVSAAEQALGWPTGAFMQAYERNLDTGALDIVDNDPFSGAIFDLLAQTGEWEGTAKELLRMIQYHAEDFDGHRPKLPATPRAVSNELYRRANVLKRAGVQVERPTRGKARLIILRRLAAGTPDAA